MMTIIHLTPNASALERKTANELQRYIRLLFGFTPVVRTRLPAKGSAISIATVDMPAESYAIRSRGQRVEITGGSPIASLWAGYELIEQWGVHYLVQGDVMPDARRPFRMPHLNVVRTPVFESRVFRVVNDFVHSSVMWSGAEHERLFDQLVKLRFNSIYIATYAHQPWFDFSFRGVKRTSGDIDYGWRHVIHERSIGKELFPRLGHFTNPDFRGCETWEQRLAAGRRFMHGLMRAAHTRGMRCILGHHLTDFPEEIKRCLPRWSKGVRLPRSEMSLCHAHTLGLAKDGGGHRFGHLMTPLNPVFLEMNEAYLRAALSEYPEIDGLLLGQSEFPPSSGGVNRCWRDLDQRHGLSPRFKLDSILRKARKVMPYSPGRGLREAQGAIVSLRLLDLAMNESRALRELLPPQAKVYGTFFSEVVMPVVPHVLDPKRFEFVAIVDYLPAHVAKNAGTLAFARNSPMKVHLITTIEDDNVGHLPQMNAPFLHVTARKMSEFGVAGFWLRQWLVSKHEPAMAYLIDAAWDHSATPAKTERRQIERVCGKAAIAPMLAAFRGIERSIDLANTTIPLGFMTPGIMKRVWEEGEPEPPSAWHDLIRAYQRILVPLRRARAVTAPRGRAYVDNMIAFVDFARRYVETAREVKRAKQHHLAAKAESGRGSKCDLDRYDQELWAAANHLARAVWLMEESLRIWAGSVRDPSDLGTLAGLNAFALDYLRGKADEVRQEAEFWGLQI